MVLSVTLHQYSCIHPWTYGFTSLVVCHIETVLMKVLENTLLGYIGVDQIQLAHRSVYASSQIVTLY
jgi:hypothetical protein